MEVRRFRVVTLSSRVEPTTAQAQPPAGHQSAILNIGTYTERLITHISGRAPRSHASPAQSIEFAIRLSSRKMSDAAGYTPSCTLFPYQVSETGMCRTVVRARSTPITVSNHAVVWNDLSKLLFPIEVAERVVSHRQLKWP